MMSSSSITHSSFSSVPQDDGRTQAFGQALTSPGAFVVGCNYWASHAGTFMWQDWRPDVVAQNLRALSDTGLQVLRVFPLWPDFQPITQLYGGVGIPVEVRHGELPLPDDAAGQAGMSAVMLDRFAEFLDLAQQHGLQVIVSLLAGWMSGRLHVPPALAGMNVLTDPRALQWELRFVRHIVRTFQDHPAILGWDLGNECNCMGEATREEAWTWTAAIANAIRAEDSRRPVLSGMHSLTLEGAWRILDQGELTDVLTTHPYPLFTPHCAHDPINTARSILHSTAESRLYSDISGRPCLCQEMGTLGPVMASEEIAADYTRACLFSLWANDCHGLLWWCAHEQTALTHAPYDWCTVERELGLLREDGSAKPVMHVLHDFSALLASFPHTPLPPHTREAVCILTQGQDQWAAAYSAYILAKQAGFDLEFQSAEQPLKPASLYLLPSISGLNIMPWRRMQELLARVEAGATLYLSLDDALPSAFEPITGLEPQTREHRRAAATIMMTGPDTPECSIPVESGIRVTLRPTRATVLGREADGNPGFTVAPYGRGTVYVLTTPLERQLAETPGAFHTPDAAPYWQVYRHIAREAIAARVVQKTHPLVAVTEHLVDAANRLVIAINQSPEEICETLTLATGWQLEAVHYGEVQPQGPTLACTLPHNNAMVLTLHHEA